MKKSFVLACVCALMISATGYARMHGGGFGGGDRLPPGKWWHMPQMAETLKLTAEEKTRLDTLFLEKRKAMISFEGEMATQRLELETLMENADFDEAATLEKFEAIQGIGQNMWKKRIQFLIEVRKLLGKERFIQLKTTFHQFHGKGKGKMKKGCPAGMGPPPEDGEEGSPKGRMRWGWGQ
ncbi:MAG: periplasmic heavy metal sensor [Candidatus Magnetomorum sp.]|nr:periplasmic heavy metal sensor [Candidatus Magnetomorum sp.]